MPGYINMPYTADKAIDIDVVFLQDCTESQQPYIDTVRKYVKDAIPMIKSQANLKGGSARYRVIAFRDHADQGCDWLLKLHDFTTDPSVLANQLATLVASGGGNGPEAQIDGLDAARRSPWRQTAKKIVILITDSPPHGIGEPGDTVSIYQPEALTHQFILNSYNKKDIHINVLACVPGITYYEKAEEFYRDLTQKTSGLYIPIPEPHTNPEPMKRAVVGFNIRNLTTQNIEVFVSKYTHKDGSDSWFAVPPSFNDASKCHWNRNGWELIAFRESGKHNVRRGWYVDCSGGQVDVTFVGFSQDIGITRH